MNATSHLERPSAERPDDRRLRTRVSVRLDGLSPLAKALLSLGLGERAWSWRGAIIAIASLGTLWVALVRVG